MIKKTLNVNGIDRVLIIDQESLLCDVLRKTIATDRYEGRLWHRPMRCLQRYRRR